METFVCDHSLGNFRLDISLGNFRFETFAWEFYFWIFRLETFPWDLSLDIFRLGCFAWELSFGIVRLGTFVAWDLLLGTFCVGSSALKLWMGNCWLGVRGKAGRRGWWVGRLVWKKTSEAAANKLMEGFSNIPWMVHRYLWIVHE